MIFNKGNYKIYLGLVLAFTVGCDGKVITNNSKDIDLINKFCLNKEPNVNLDINKYLPSESSMENPIKKNLGISVVNFFDKIQNGKKLDNMNIYENQGYIDIIDDNYDSIGRIIIIPDGEYVKYINLEVRSAPDIFKKEILKKTIVGVINVLNNHGDSEIAYNKMLGNLLVNMKNGVFNLKNGIYSGSFKDNEIVYEISTINKKFIASKVASGEIKDVNCKTRKYHNYSDIELSIFSIYRK
ncbi:hypothetical protein [Acinetobacter bereziniae]|uniref:hypothetical protein n=1 Tax=Acinetobacter bereziniae TaxID=106648 RepID=UPI001900FC07|nr:hypothetical protein [Acinetobacter bereziniae]MBJ8551264.1 hypothetical protein [Acinetobacter bereziniae]